MSEQAHAAMPPQRLIGDVLKEKRLALGWALDQASKKTAIPAAALSAIEENALDMFINDGAKLDLHIRIYANRLGVSLIPYQELIQKARSSIKPKAITADMIDFILHG